jgi:hypothetical protein
MRSIVVILSLLVLSPNAIAAGKWQTFRDPDRVFSFETPEQVKVNRKEQARPDGTRETTTMFAFGQDKPGAFSCGVARTELKDVGVDETAPTVVATSLRATLTAAGTKPYTDSKTTRDGYSGWQMQFKDRWGDGVWFQWYVVKGKMYQVICTLPPNASAAQIASATRASGSFHILVH